MKFAVFDIDGTLIRWQLYHALVDKLADNGVLSKAINSEIQIAKMRWKRRECPESYKAYEKKLVLAYESVLKDIPTGLFDKLVVEVLEQYRDQAYTYTRNLIKVLKKADYFLISISGSHHELVSKLGNYYGFDISAGSRYEREDGNFSGAFTVASHDKKSILESIIKKQSLELIDSYAIGDSKSDAVILKMVSNPVAFNPDKELFNIAEKNKWKIVLERKNMVYELEYKDGTYELAKAGE